MTTQTPSALRIDAAAGGDGAPVGCLPPDPRPAAPERDAAMSEHNLRCEPKDDPREFRAVCSCGWVSIWRPTNACMGNGRRHVAAVRKSRT